MQIKISAPSPARQVTTLGLAAAIACTALWAEASDHIDFPSDAQAAGEIGEPVSDITDLLAFTSPNNPSNLVVAFNVNNMASSKTRFSDQVNYTIRLREAAIAGTGFDIAPEEHSIVCNYEGQSDSVTCVFDGARSVTTAFNDESGGSANYGKKPILAFAGLRHDSFFIDINGVRGTLIPPGDVRNQFREAHGIRDLESTLVMPTENPDNSMAPLNIMSFVLEFDPYDVFGVDSTIFAIVAETSKKKAL